MPSTKASVRPKQKRSRNGCLSCKQLRIKCDESKPNCEYCLHTNRVCVYPDTVHYDKIISKSQSSSSDSPSSEEDILELLQNVDYSQEKYLKLRAYRRNPMYSGSFRFDQIASLNELTSKLNISTFELRLLNYFDRHCIYMFSFGVNDEVHNVWKNHVPSIFLQSKLVRDSVFSFSAINMFPHCDLELLKYDDDMYGRIKLDRANKTVTYDPNAVRTKISPDDEDTLYDRTAKYFMDSINKTNITIGSGNIQGPSIPVFRDDLTAKELVVSGILIFSFLAIHPHKLLPLVSFAEDETDFLSMCLGISATMISCQAAILRSELSGMFIHEERGLETPSLKDCTYPLLMKLKQDLDQIYGGDEFDSIVATEYNILSSTLQILHTGLYRSVKLNYPIPLFKWTLMISPNFRDLVYEKNFFALRILYVYSSLCMITRFMIYNDSNMWLDYIHWYKDYNLENFGNKWVYPMDEKSYELTAVKKYMFEGLDYTALATFDPDVM
ncbi:hypothetical protein G9P44_000974 [Scheffersomyces stipitis]|nr:hypothetical protein G9P44_000974 [Scheffersomyces stipitis]